MSLAEQVQNFGEDGGQVYELLVVLDQQGLVDRAAERGEAAIYKFVDGSAWGTDWGVMTALDILEVAALNKENYEG